MRILIRRAVAVLLALALTAPLCAAAEPTEGLKLQPVYPTGGQSHESAAELPLQMSDQVSSLSAAEPEVDLETLLIEGLMNCQEEIVVYDYNIPVSGGFDFFYDLVRNNPELYYVFTSLSYSRIPNTDRLYSIFPNYNEALTTPEAKVRMEEAIDRAMDACVRPGMTDLDLALAFHDYLVLNCAYNWQIANHVGNYLDLELPYTSYGALVEGDAVCQGYALAYNLLLGRMGIDSQYVSSSAMNHGWSRIQLDDAWYHVDITWDDAMFGAYEVPGDTTSKFRSYDMPGYCQHKFFLLTDRAIQDPKLMGKYDIHYDYDDRTVPCTDSRYLSGWAFNDAITGFYPMENSFAYTGARSSAPWSPTHAQVPFGQLDQGEPGITYTTLSLFRDNTIYYMQGAYADIDAYDYTFQKAFTALDASDLSFNPLCYGMAWEEDGLWAVQPCGTSYRLIRQAAATASPQTDWKANTATFQKQDNAGSVTLQAPKGEVLTTTVTAAAYDPQGRLLEIITQVVELTGANRTKMDYQFSSHLNIGRVQIFGTSSQWAPYFPALSPMQ